MKRGVFVSILLACSFLVIKFFFGGIRFAINEILPEFIIFAVFTVIMTIVPLIFRLVKKADMNKKIGFWVCLLNGIIVTVLTIIPNIVMIISWNGHEDVGMSWSPVTFSKGMILVDCIMGVIYYFVNYLLFVV